MVYFLKVKKKQEEYVIRKRGKYLFFLNNFSGKLNVLIENNNCQVFIFGVYIGKGSEEFNLNTYQIHKKGESLSNLLVKGIFLDKSKFLYEGLIRIEKEANNSTAYQKNQNLVLSDNCLIESKPYLEILANDVFCTHGSTTSNLNKEQIFYLKARGLSEKKATFLLVEGFLFDIFFEMEKILGKNKTNYLYQKTKKQIENILKYI